jgi:16S rRNA (guanine966-N2)-methyltransferase
MRVIGGEFRSRKLKTVPGLNVRPTPDRLRESLFSILSPRIKDAVFIDAYAGSGAVGIEALSRGAKQVFLIERDRRALNVIEENLTVLDIAGRITVLRGPAADLLKRQPADLVFLDPPYDRENEYRDSLLALSEADCPYCIAQHASRLILDDAYGQLRKTRVLTQGDNSLSFFEPSGTR